MNVPVVEKLLQRLELAQPLIEARDRRYRGIQPLRYTVDEVEGDLKNFSVNLCRLAVQAVAERIRPRKITASVAGVDVSARAQALWLASNMDMKLQSVVADCLALGSVYLIAWVDRYGNATLTAESAKHVITSHDPVNNEVTGAVKRWFEKDHNGVVVQEHVIFYGTEKIIHYTRDAHNVFQVVNSHENMLGVVPVTPVINFDRIGDDRGYSVIDDLGQLVDALSKILADVLTASESVARPKRWAAGIDLEDSQEVGFTADGAPTGAVDPALDEQAVSPFEDGSAAWVVENDNAKFGQLPGADLGGYKTAVDLVLQEIMAVSALPAHMMGVTTSNPTSADAIRAAEASLTARAEGRIKVIGLAIEEALRLLVAIDRGTDPRDVTVQVDWASPATRSVAQEADAITKYVALGIMTPQEARDRIGITE